MVHVVRNSDLVVSISALFLENIMERDKFMNPEAAKALGLIDLILQHPPIAENTNS